MENLAGSNTRDIAFQRAEISQLRANHQRVPRIIQGWGLTKKAIFVGGRYWIFGAPRASTEVFYWMHTNVICEIEEGEDYVEFETASRSIYRIEFLEGGRPSWISDELETLMVAYVLSF